MNGDVVKKIRGIVKQAFPFGLEVVYVRHKYGLNLGFLTARGTPFVRCLVRFFVGMLPFGLVRWYERWRMEHTRNGMYSIAEKLGLFDREWYRAQNKDVDFTHTDPCEHFFTVGWQEYRDPSESFSVLAYQSRYADVLASGICPLAHFLLRGRWEGRRTCAPGAFLGGGPSRRDRRCAARRDRRPFFSVVVASYNYEDLVLETLQSLVDQTYHDFEVVIVDDGSTDHSRENIEKFLHDHRACGVKMALYTHPDEANCGLAETVRLGVERCTGEFVAFCEADDLWTPDHLAVLADFIAEYGAAEVIANDLEIFGDPVRVTRFNMIKALRYEKLRHVRNRISPSEFRQLNYLLTFSATTVRRDVLVQCDWKPVARPAALDWWLWRQICFDRPVYFVNRVLTRWRMHDSYMFRTQSSEDQVAALVDLHRDFICASDELLIRQHPFSPTARIVCRKRPSPENPYELTGRLRESLVRRREAGLEKFREEIARNAHARILVCLHLFYEESWPLIAEYLRNLAPYDVEYVITCVQQRISEATLEEIRAFSDRVRIVFTPNRGFDIGPFVESLREIDLGKYDIVYKLQSKGMRRPRLYIYGQLFKKSDWFFNLYNGVLDGCAVHETVDVLMRGGARMAAAKNLIVRDPVHKQFFVRRFCEERGLAYLEDYRFVAGTCFAVRAEALRPLQNLRLSIGDFASAKPGTFSLAHALERWMCFAAEGALHGVETPHPDYRGEVLNLEKQDAIRLLDRPEFKLDYDFFYRVLEMRPIPPNGYQVVKVRLGDLTRYWYDGRVYKLEECPPYRYLCGDKAAYEEYCRYNQTLTGFEMSPERFEELCASMKEYDPLKMPVVLGPRNIIQDGQHRSCILLKKFGPDHEIDALRLACAAG